MPSKKSLARGANAKGQRNKAQAPTSGALPIPHMPSNHAKEQLQRLTAKADECQDPLRHLRNSSCSTDEGSSASSCSSNSPHGSEASGSPMAESRTQQHSHTKGMRMSSDSTPHICAANMPLWMDNGSKGDKAAWLLVMPKEEASNGAMLKSPKDAILLGPYVTMKNTFLEESRVDGAIQRHRRPRAKSWDTYCPPDWKVVELP